MDNHVAQRPGVAHSIDPWKPTYHIRPSTGWINDPNGLVYFGHEFHVFFQYHPYSSEWGPMHWGHVKSKDLVSWEVLPNALTPTEFYDKDGCFSGSAVDDDGVLTLIYTGNREQSEQVQTQCLAISRDGINFTKSASNPVISEPPMKNSAGFRDPKVWKGDGVWYMVVGTGWDGRGRVVLYSSPDLTHWSDRGVIAESDGSQGFMWECPDLFPLGEQWVLIVSAIYEDGHKTIYMTGTMDFERMRFIQQYAGNLDSGSDLYAPQTFNGLGHRRILLGWMHNWEGKNYTGKYGWAGMLTIPRELALLPDGRLQIQPVRELQKLRSVETRYADLCVSSQPLVLPQGIRLEIEVFLETSISNSSQFGLRLRCSSDMSEYTLLYYEPETSELVLDTVHSGEDRGGVHRAICLLEHNQLSLRLFLDSSSLEVFANHGELVMTTRIYPHSESIHNYLYADDTGVRIRELNVWELRPTVDF